MPPYAFYKNGFMPLSEAKMGVMTHALHYGTACFEGIRANWNADDEQLYIFRCGEHFERLLKNCKILDIDLPYAVDDLCKIATDLVQKSGYKEDVYIRPLAYKSSEVLGVRLHDLEADLLMIVTTFGPYLDISKGIKCCTSSWRRIEDSIIPARGKIAGLSYQEWF
jgi:branched-chain amino acid aminotransferase